ncbi:MAG: hypothetical protein LBG45_07780, partial [Dysgonamonadaceae bacterium]|nr:hypothetical protein [Dysgonamonadaceae bacterium]
NQPGYRPFRACVWPAFPVRRALPYANGYKAFSLKLTTLGCASRRLFRQVQPVGIVANKVEPCRNRGWNNAPLKLSPFFQVLF